MKMRSNNDSRHACVSLCLALVVVLTCYGSVSAQVAPGNPISAYLFDDVANTTTAVDSFGSNNGTFVAEPGGTNVLPSRSVFDPLDLDPVTPFGYTGNASLRIFDEAIVVDGQEEFLSNWVTLGNPANLDFVADDGAGGGDTFTISAWVQNEFGGTFVSKAGGGAPDRQYQLWSNGTGASKVDFIAGGTSSFSEPDIPNRTIFGAPFWDHVAMVVESPTVAKFYVNGFLAVTMDPGTIVQPTAEILFGARHAENPPVDGETGFNYEGSLDEVAFWDSALTQENIDWLQTNSLSTLLAAGPDGDFDGDGDVDGADFLDWQRNLGDAASLGQWEANFGTNAAVSAVASVPEPASLLLMGLGALSMTLRSVRRRR